MPIAAGTMRDRVSYVEQAEVKTDRGGFEVGLTTVYRRVPAKVEPLSGVELQRAAQVDPRQKWKVTMRYLSGIRAEQYVIYHRFDGDRTLEIVEPPLVNEKDRTMVLMCGEAPASAPA